jgi:hypothetical protein
MATARGTALTTTAGSPATPGVSIAATFTFSNGTPITINSGDLAQLKAGVVNFSLTQPVVLGSLSDFIQWLTTQFGLPDINAEVNDLGTEIQNNPLLKSLYSAFMSFYNGIITINTLVINRTSSSYRFQLGVTLDLKPPIDFFEFIQFDSIGVLVNTAGGTLSPS